MSRPYPVFGRGRDMSRPYPEPLPIRIESLISASPLAAKNYGWRGPVLSSRHAPPESASHVTTV
jgi:hypothetical protein